MSTTYNEKTILEIETTGSVIEAEQALPSSSWPSSAWCAPIPGS
jgi:hypothetical protein